MRIYFKRYFCTPKILQKGQEGRIILRRTKLNKAINRTAFLAAFGSAPMRPVTLTLDTYHD